MKTFILAILFAIAAPAFAFDECAAGSWFDPARDGEGINVEVLDDQVVAYFYTFDGDRQTWFVMVGDRPESGAVRLGAFQYVKLSESPFEVWEIEVGSASLEYLGAGEMLFSFEFQIDPYIPNVALPYCLAGHCQGEYIYSRLTGPPDC